MSIIGLLWGIVAFILMLVGLIPFLGWLNWLIIPFAAVGLILSAVGYMRRRSPAGLAGIILGGVVILVGIARLSLGGGFF